MSSRRMSQPVRGACFAALVLAIVGGVLAQAPPASAGPAIRRGTPVMAPGFVATAPERIVDTRSGQGGTGPIVAGQTLTVAVPASVPLDATGVALTVTADQGAVPGYVTAYPCGSNKPLASLLNPQTGEPRSNQLVVAVDSTRQVCFFTNTTVQLIVDLTGWLVPGGDAFHAVTPFRALDTRFGPRPDGGSGQPAAGSVLELPMTGANGIAANATGVAVNITLTNPAFDGFVTAYPCGAATPTTSTGNAPAGGTRASFTFVGLGAGSLCLFVPMAADLVVDVTGYFGPSGGTPVYPATPRRILDTRFDGLGMLTPGVSRPVRLGLPAGTTNAALNVTAVDAVAPGWVRLSPCGTDPGTSSVNYASTAAIANVAVTMVGADEDSVCITSNVATHVVIDVAAASTRGTVAAFEVSSGGVLYPAFRPDILDYVVLCPSAGPNALVLWLAAEPGGTVNLDNQGAVVSGDPHVNIQPGQMFSVVFDGPGGNATYRVRCLPPDFPAFSSHRFGAPASGWYVVTPPVDSGAGSYVTVFDREGVPVWWYREATATADGRYLTGPSRLQWANSGGQPFNADPSVNYKQHALNGGVVGQLSAVGTPTDYHDVALLSNGNHLVTSYVPRQHVDLSAIGEGTDQNVIDAHIQEVGPLGTLVWQWNSEDHIAVTETLERGRFAYPGLADPAVDLLHVNAVSEDGDGFIVSARHMDAVFRIDRATKNLTWKLGGTPSASPGVKNLAFVNDPQSSVVLQHDARLQPDGTLTLFDNRAFGRGDARAVRYSLDIPAGTATLLEQVKNPDATLSFFQGSARRTAAGTWVVNWGGSTITTEQDPTGKKLFELRFATAVSYRGVPIAPGDLTRDALSNGMVAQHPR